MRGWVGRLRWQGGLALACLCSSCAASFWKRATVGKADDHERRWRQDVGEGVGVKRDAGRRRVGRGQSDVGEGGKGGPGGRGPGQRGEEEQQQEQRRAGDLAIYPSSSEPTAE